ncbi:MAG TPA: cysteine methyltransferase, partial [Clostridiales bacterium]|nr:cysteine methyltransferase [Clostridiales bacterium]
MSDFFNRVYEFVKRVPAGKVVTYGDVARAIGSPRASRQVGWALHVNPEPGIIPCHRVVFRDGSLAPGFAFGGREVQKAMLESEGIKVSEDFKI